jgi:hypothetical protein
MQRLGKIAGAIQGRVLPYLLAGTYRIKAQAKGFQFCGRKRRPRTNLEVSIEQRMNDCLLSHMICTARALHRIVFRSCMARNRCSGPLAQGTA